jgi:hypothetical protein
MCAGRLKIILAVSDSPMCTLPSMHPAMNNGLVYELSIECTSDLTGIVHAFPLAAIYQEDISLFPEPIRRNLSVCSSHDISKTASYKDVNIIRYSFFDQRHGLYCVIFEGFDVYGACTYNTEVCSRANSKEIGCMR